MIKLVTLLLSKYLFKIIITSQDNYSERQRNLLSDLNDLHTSMIIDHADIKDYLQTEIIDNK